MLMLPAVRMVPKSDEGVRPMIQEYAEALRHAVGVSKLKDKAVYDQRRVATYPPEDLNRQKAPQVNRAVMEVENG
ncbi:hypothetical protein VIGAN_10106400 [Vigna angularis var. angularis]|uniref:Uncharacterized protein n=1 Tax=Vigna angularis var. angularis TaxID=157739 RepID=A0A0S3T3X6_PHAAN|nr:hypothetical protein VIGAN_10106400 [Vigna angularis var. angularis]